MKLLRRELLTEGGSDQEHILHCRASTWFEEYELLDEALHHALAAGDIDLAARQITGGLHKALNQEDRPTLERWLRMLPEETIRKNPGLLMLRFWSLQFLWRLDLQAHVLHQVEERIDKNGVESSQDDYTQILRAQIMLAKAQFAFFSNQTTQATEFSRQAFALLPPSWTYVRGGAMVQWGLSKHNSGEGAAAERLLLSEYITYGDKSDAYSLRLLMLLCFNYINSGQLEQTRQLANLILKRQSSKIWGS
jgi:LuxR family transcriptional regulator, maltose regulon positive regulatory protein